MRFTFEIKPGNKLGKRIERADKRDRKEARREKQARRAHFA
jgi:hypothetical protein